MLYVNQLPYQSQMKIKVHVIEKLLELRLSDEEFQEALENAMTSKLSDLDKVGKVYKVQSYLVKFDTMTPVDINVSVYHNDKTELTRDEIINEAIGYCTDVGLTDLFLDGMDIEIEELEKR